MPGVSERTFRRWTRRYEEEGEAGLLDRRLGKASGKRVPVDRAEEVERLYRERLEVFTAIGARQASPMTCCICESGAAAQQQRPLVKSLAFRLSAARIPCRNSSCQQRADVVDDEDSRRLGLRLGKQRNRSGRKNMLKRALGATALATIFLSGGAFAQDKIKVGVTATLEGTYTILGVDGIAGFNAAVKKYGGKAGGKELEFVIASTDATPDLAVRAVQKLIEQDHVQILISPLSGDEGIAVKNFSKTHPELTFINAASGAQETTFPDPSPNFFRWNMDGAQWRSASATTPITTRATRRSRPSAKTIRSSTPRCSALFSSTAPSAGRSRTGSGCRLARRTSPRRSRRLPDDVDAIYLGLGGADAVNFLNQYQQAGGKAHLWADRSWSTRPCFRPRATRRGR